jgi:nucleoside-diphosphate-sugar epimerase
VKHSQADIKRAGALLGYAPSVPFEDGLQRTLGWYRSTMAATSGAARNRA